MKKQMKSSIIATFRGGEFNLKIVAPNQSRLFYCIRVRAQ